MRNEIPEMYRSRIEERPEGIASGSRCTSKYDQLAKTLNLISASKAIVFDINEAVKMFGKHYKTNLKQQLRKRGIRKPRLAIDGTKVHVWQISV